MKALESAGGTARRGGPASLDELLTDLGFALAVVVAAIHMHVGAAALRQATSGEVSLLFPLLTLGAAAGVGGLLFVDESDLLPPEAIHRLGIGLAALLLLGYVDFTALGVVAPLMGVETPQAREPVIVLGYLYVDLIAKSNILALASMLAEIGMITVFGGLYLTRDGILPFNE